MYLAGTPLYQVPPAGTRCMFCYVDKTMYRPPAPRVGSGSAFARVNEHEQLLASQRKMISLELAAFLATSSDPPELAANHAAAAQRTHSLATVRLPLQPFHSITLSSGVTSH